MAEGSAAGENIYMYRCLDRGLIGSVIEFRLGDSIDVRASCDASISGAYALAATFTAAVTLMTVA